LSLSNERLLALKVDCDTFEGTKKGIPQLLKVFDRFHIRASFFFTLGPDTSGRAIRRIFTQKGFLKKMLRSNAVSLYGPKTMMYGTLLPSPLIGKKLAPIIKSVEAAGHEVGVHGWDHIRWHDSLAKLSEQEIARDYDRAHQTFEDIFGHKAHSSAAPGWHITGPALRVQEKFNLLYTSNTRIGSPFFPMAGDEIFQTLEIPSTIPTWDEMLGDPDFKEEGKFLKFYQEAVRGVTVHSIHTEVEGTAHEALFEKQLGLWSKDGIKFLTLEEIANETLKNRSSISYRNIFRTAIPNRGGLITSSL
jgi:undecaprenyl phosphate-alpha-L-ara4FN deformylase